MGFFNNPSKAFKGFCKDPVGRIGKDTGLWNNGTDCKPQGYTNACGSGANVGALAVAAAGAATFKGVPGIVVGSVGGGTAGCVKGIADYNAVCKVKPFSK